MKCAETRAYCLPTVERPNGSCAVLTGSLAEKEFFCVIAAKFHCREEGKKRKRYVHLLLSELILEEGRKEEV